jgi:hypothetical protein
MKARLERTVPTMTPGACVCRRGPCTWKGGKVQICYTPRGARIRGKC